MILKPEQALVNHLDGQGYHQAQVAGATGYSRTDVVW